MAEVTEAVRLPRRLGPVLLTLYGVGVMVGAGIYVLVGTVAGNAGILAPLAFVAAGLVAAPTALSYAELSVRMPESSGEAAYVRAALHQRWPATVVGLVIVVVGTTSAAAVLRGGVGYLQTLIDVPAGLLIVAVAGILLAVAIVGVVESLAFAAVLTVIEVVGLVLVIGAGFGSPPSAEWSQGLPTLEVIPWAGLGLAMVLAFFAFIGFEDIVNLAEEVKRPYRTLPIAIIASLVIAAVLYAAVSVAAIRVVDPAALADTDSPLALVYERGGGNPEVLALIAAFAALNGVLAQLVMAARVLFGLGRHTPALATFTRTHSRFKTPALASVTIASLTTAAALVADVESLAELTATFLLAVFIIMNVALIIIKRHDPQPSPTEGGSFTVPVAVPWLGLVGSIAALAIAIVA